jgi:hypothetical protein
MATLNINVADAKVAKVQAFADAYNVLHGTDLTLRQFAVMALRLGLGHIAQELWLAERREQDVMQSQELGETQEAVT